MNVRYFEKRPGSWHLDFRGPDGRRLRPFGGSTRAEAEREAPAVIARALGAPASPPKATLPTGGPTIVEAYKLGLRTRESWITSKSKGTLQQTFDQLGLPDTTPCAALTRDFVRDLRGKWMAEEGKRKGSKLSPSTINHRLSMLSVLLEVADAQPHGVKHLSTRGTRRTRRISDDEIRAACQWCVDNINRRGAAALRVMILLALDTAAREGELLGLSWQDVGEGTVTFRDTKNGETRTVPLTPRAAGLLQARRTLPAPFSDLDKGRLGNLWSDMRHALGLATDDEFVFHALRHEAVSRLIETPGVSPFTVQAIAGHKNITTTQVYAHASLGAMLRAINPGAEP